MLQRPLQQFLPRGKDGASEAGETHREAFFAPFSLLKPPPGPFFLPHVSFVCCNAPSGPPPPPPPPPLGRVLVYFSPSTPPIEAEQQQGVCTCPSLCCFCRVPVLCEPHLWVSVKARQQGLSPQSARHRLIILPLFRKDSLESANVDT